MRTCRGEPVGVGDLEQHRVLEGGQPALRAGGADAGDLGVGVVEEGLQLLQGERPLGRVGFGLLAHGRVPLVDHLDGVGAEAALAASWGQS